MTSMNPAIVCALAIALLAVILLRRKFDFVTNKLNGPPSPSWFLGHEFAMRYQDQVGDLDFAWVREYGATFAIKSCWGRTSIMTADPKALQHIFHASGYRYPKRPDLVQMNRNLMGRGILATAGDEHQRHRKVMNPAFTAQQLKAFLPLFQKTASNLSQKWKDQMQANSTTFNVSRWLARATLDTIGESAFDYDFNALENDNGELTKTFENLFADSHDVPPPHFIPSKEYRRFRHFRNLAQSVAKQLLDGKVGSIDSARDVMSLLAKANVSVDPKRQLDEDEILAQMATIMVAGHETTASSLSWMLYELSRHPDDQKRVREEMRQMRQTLPHGEAFSLANLESLQFTNAVIKEALRLHPIGPSLVRTASCDDRLPLGLPITTKDGDIIQEIPIPKGTDIFVSICAYNRLPEIWGPDADQWNPRRFLEQSQISQTSVGVFANLMTFSAGVRGCIGWRFAIIEIQALLAEMIENFEFNLPKDVEIVRLPAVAMVPMSQLTPPLIPSASSTKMRYLLRWPGHEMTASSLSWLLYELSKHPEDQKRVRDELLQMRQTVSHGEDISLANLEQRRPPSSH
ncbi:hypothetical protein ONZ45_g13198 [Pleurotus djamor]|nr:hypothetical protein ONZ45_g13198 [Pleurotus djamor]